MLRGFNQNFSFTKSVPTKVSQWSFFPVLIIFARLVGSEPYPQKLHLTPRAIHREVMDFFIVKNCSIHF